MYERKIVPWKYARVGKIVDDNQNMSLIYISTLDLENTLLLSFSWKTTEN